MYALVIPPELVHELYLVRKKTGKSIRSQILNAVKKSITDFKTMERETNRSFISADILIKTNGGEKLETSKNI